MVVECMIILKNLIHVVFLDGDDLDQVQICFVDKSYSVPRHILLLHSSRLCDIIRSKTAKIKEKIKITINRESKWFPVILNYMYTGYVSLPKADADIYELMTEVAYFNIPDMAERVKMLIQLNESFSDGFEKNQVHSMASSINPRTRMTLTVASPLIYKNPAPAPIAKSENAESYAKFLLELSLFCNQEAFVWIVCSSSCKDMKEAEIKELGEKHLTLGGIACPITAHLTEATYSRVYCHIACQNHAGTVTLAHAEIPFVVSVKTVPQKVERSTRTRADSMAHRYPVTELDRFAEKEEVSLPEEAEPYKEDMSISFSDTICSKSDILSLLSVWKAKPRSVFSIKSITAEGIGKETAEALILAISKNALPQLQSLNIADNDMGTAVSAELANALAMGACPNLHTLILHDNRIGSTVGNLFADIISHQLSNVLEVLDIKHNRLKADGCLAILNAIQMQSSVTIKSFLFSDNEETQSTVYKALEIVAEGHTPHLQQIEWTASLSQNISISIDLLRRVQAKAPNLSLPLSTITFPEVSPAQIADIFGFIAAGLLSRLSSLQWTQGPSSFLLTPVITKALSSLDKKMDSMRLPQIRNLDLSDLSDDDVSIILKCLTAGMFTSLQGIVMNKSGVLTINNANLLLLNQFLHSGYYNSSMKLKETVLKGDGITDKGIESLIVILQVGLLSELQEINLQNNLIHDASACNLSNCLAVQGSNVTIKLNGNPIMKPDTWYTVSKMLFKTTAADAGLKSFADSIMDVVLEAVYRQRKALILEDVDAESLTRIIAIIRSGALSCLRELSISQSGIEDENLIVELVSTLDDKTCMELKKLNLVFSGLNCGIGDQTLIRLSEIIKNGNLPSLELLNLSDCYINKSSDTLLVKALKSGAKKMKKLGIKTKRSSMTPSCVNLLASQQNKKSLRARSRSPSR